MDNPLSHSLMPLLQPGPCLGSLRGSDVTSHTHLLPLHHHFFSHLYILTSTVSFSHIHRLSFCPLHRVVAYHPQPCIRRLDLFRERLSTQFNRANTSTGANRTVCLSLLLFLSRSLFLSLSPLSLSLSPPPTATKAFYSLSKHHL